MRLFGEPTVPAGTGMRLFCIAQTRAGRGWHGSRLFNSMHKSLNRKKQVRYYSGRAERRHVALGLIKEASRGASQIKKHALAAMCCISS
ncbi:hypothetical protein PSAC2689_190065 [Paraburkholderia sacchari]